MMEVLLFSINAHSYGVRKDRVGSVEKVGAVHRLPFLKSSVTVLAVIGDHTSTLADLAPCLGHGPDQGKSAPTALVMSQQGQIRGFLVSAEPSSLTVEPEAVFGLPDYLRIPFVESFLLQNGDLVPVIAVQALFEHVLSQGNPAKPSAPAIQGVPATETVTATNFTLADAGGSLLALRAQEFHSAPGGHRISRFPLLPPDIDGVILGENQVLPVVDIARRVSRRPLGESPVLLQAKVGSATFGLLVDGDRGEWRSDETTVKDLPFICQTPWLQKAALHGNQAAAIVDLAALLSRSPDADYTATLSARYRPESSFPSLFGRQEVEVIEVLVKGRRLAIPRSEVIDVIPCAPTHAVPHAPGVVSAVGASDGDLLPVIDLARILGASSSPTAQWRMILLSNGTFRALVLSESAPETRLVKPATQRDVPVHLPYPVVYGCYTEGEGIRLILNIHALALHFDESRAAELLPSLSPVETTWETETLLPEKAGTEAQTAGAQTAVPVVEALPLPEVEAARKETGTGEAESAEPLFQEVSPPPDEQTVEQPVEQPNPAMPAETSEAPAPPAAAAAAPSSAPPPPPIPEEKEEELFVEEVHVRKQVVVEQPAHRGRRMMAAFAASAVLIVGAVLGLYLSGLAQKPGSQGAAPQTSIAAAPAAHAPAQAPAPLRPSPAPAAPLQPANASIYTVREGDTLWDIAQRFTGDPLNYHSLAGRNLIKNPDLIFPGQTIQVGAQEKP